MRRVLERSEGGFLVLAHQPAVAGDIGCEDGGQPPFDPLLRHEESPHTLDFRPTLRSGLGCVYRATMSALGHSRHIQRTPKSTFVRCCPIATKLLQRGERSDVAKDIQGMRLN